MTIPPSLPIPPQVMNSEKSVEMARIWIADGNQIVVLSPHFWEDPAAWGLMLVDLARHVAAAYAEQGRGNAQDVLMRIKEGLDAEWDHPTSGAHPG
jgi:hypothetical protein